MIQGNDIICFCNDWDADPLSKKHIVLRLARENRVLWVNGIGNRNPTVSARDLRRIAKKLWEYCRGCRQVAQNISVFTPLVIPFHGSRLARWLNRWLLRSSLRRVCRRLGFHKPITWAFTPSSADVAGSLGERMLIYHCVDEFTRFTGADENAIGELERRLLAKADLAIVSSGPLYETKRRYNPNTFLVTHGVDVAHFRNACLEETARPEDCCGLKGPVVGFFGLVADWVDLEIIGHIARSRPDWSLLLIGEVQTNTSVLQELPNVRILGRRSYQALPGYCKVFDVAILPFVINELTLASNPLKMREYLAAGLPVVATPLPEVQKLGGLLRTARTGDEFVTQIQAWLEKGRRGPDLEVSHLMDSQSWDRKVEELSQIIVGVGSGQPVCEPTQGTGYAA